jgi:uncharacterized RDD family membrane protein YckC
MSIMNNSNTNDSLKIPVWWKRFLSFLIDILIVFVPLSLIIGNSTNGEIGAGSLGNAVGVIIAGGPLRSIFELASRPFFPDYHIFGLLLVITYYFYCLISELSTKTTLGKKIFNIKVLSKNNDTPTSSQIFMRFLCRMIPFDPFSFISKRPRGWHDKLSSTKVVEIINWQHM